MLGTYSISRSVCISPNQTEIQPQYLKMEGLPGNRSDVLHAANSYSHEHVYELPGDIIWACVLLLGEVTNSHCVTYPYHQTCFSMSHFGLLKC